MTRPCKVLSVTLGTVPRWTRKLRSQGENVKIAATILLLTGVLLAQTPIQDVSVAGSPLFFASTMTADKFWANNVTAQNVSTKEILAYVIDYNGYVGYE